MHRPIWRSANGHYKSKLQMFEELDERIKKLEENCLGTYVDRCIMESLCGESQTLKMGTRHK
jgi:hypothetical protein